MTSESLSSGHAIIALLAASVLVQLAVLIALRAVLDYLSQDKRDVASEVEKIARRVMYDYAKWNERVDRLEMDIDAAEKERRKKYKEFSDYEAHRKLREATSDDSEDGTPAERDYADLLREYESVAAEWTLCCLQEEMAEAEIEFLDNENDRSVDERLNSIMNYQSVVRKRLEQLSAELPEEY